MSTPRISVLMAVRDGLPYLREALDSILTQSRTDFEFLVIDDGSADGSREMAEEIGDPRIRVLINERNLGLTRSLNLGLRAAQGEYLARQDADDVSLPQRLEVQADYLDRNPEVGLTACSVEYMDSEGGTECVDARGLSAGVLRWHLLFGNEIPHSGVMFRRREVLDLGGYDESLPFAQDYELWSRLSRRTDLVRLERVLLRYRRHQGALSATRKEEQYRIRDLIGGANMARLLKREVDPGTIRALHTPGPEKGRCRDAARLIRELGKAFLESGRLSGAEVREVRADLKARLRGVAKSHLRVRPGEALAVLLGLPGRG